MINEKLQDIDLVIIANAGAAKGLAFEALDAAKAKDFVKADELMNQANQLLNDAHKAHTELLVQNANGELDSVDILTSHSQDHFMSSMLALELISELIEVYRRLKD